MIEVNSRREYDIKIRKIRAIIDKHCKPPRCPDWSTNCDVFKCEKTKNEILKQIEIGWQNV